MKKITLLTLLIAIPFFGIAQEFNFDDNLVGDWSPSGSCTLSAAGGNLVVDLTGDGTNPAFGNTVAGVAATTNKFAGITIKNSDAAGPTFMRVSYPKTPNGRKYVQMDITAGDADFKTYWFDLTDADWDGTEDDVKIHFKATGNTTYTIPTAGVTLLIDKIQFVAEIPAETRPERTEYEFDTDDEGWSNLVAAASNVQEGNLLIKPTAAGSIAKVTNGTYSVNADANSHMHIVYKNESDNNQLRIQFRSSVDDYTDFIGTNESISQNMSGFETLTIDLETAKPAEWSENAQDLQIAIRNTNNAGNASSAGDFVIDRIVFNNDETLTVDQFEATEFTIYPNPATDVLKINNAQELSGLEIYDLTGKRVLSVNQIDNNQISVSSLKSGIYLIRLTSANGNFTKKLIINK